MGAWFSSLFAGITSQKKIEKTPFKGGCGKRLKNLLCTHYRGLLGFIILVVFTAFTGSKVNRGRTVYCMWITMFLFFLIQPLNIPVTGMMPVYYLVLFGVMDSNTVCKLYFGPGQALFLLAGMVGMLLNISKFDRRMMFWFLKPNASFTPVGFLVKVSLAAYFSSLFSNKLLVSSYLIELLAPAFNGEGSTEEFKKYRNIILNAIQTSASIGGMAFIHGSMATLTMKIIYEESALPTFTYFEFLPTIGLAKVMFGFNLLYNTILLKVQVKSGVNIIGQAALKKAVSSGKSELPPKITAHEIQTIFFLALALFLFISRVTRFGGWQSIFNVLYAPDDMVVGAFMVILLSILPKGVSFITALKASKKSQMPPCKPESGIMFWKFVDKNTVYGYLFLIGGGNALNTAVQRNVGMRVPDHIGQLILFGGYDISLIMVAIISVILVNIMSPVAAVCVLLPLVIASMNFGGGIFAIGFALAAPAALIVGLAGSLSFTFPFKFTCAYFVHKTGKVPIKKMSGLGAGSALVCMLTLICYGQGVRYI